MRRLIFVLAASLFVMQAHGQKELSNTEGSNYKFTVDKSIGATPVENQAQSGTCWSFSTLSFFESEIERTGKTPPNLAEMFVVSEAYRDKATDYVRMHGNAQFGPGGESDDIPYVWENYGIVPESVYPGLHNGYDKPNHNEMDRVLKAYVDAVIDNDHGHPTTAWQRGFNAVVDAYLGPIPTTFTYNGKEYTPKSYAASLGLNMNDYVAVTSFTHHPFYKPFDLEIPDNWRHKDYMNVPMDDLISIIDNALKNGYTVAWGADVSEKGFNFHKGLAIVPAGDDKLEDDGTKLMVDDGSGNSVDAFTNPVKQKDITQEMRQEQFNNWKTTDDHGMQITGMVHDQNGTKYYLIKNSWGTGNHMGGYFYASEAYVKLKTTDLMVNKNAIPKDISKKMGM